jgi:ABC-type multidrug transport system permease subunit
VVIHRRYNPEAITAYNIVPGLLGVVLSLTLVMMTSLGMTREYERGTMESLLATPAKPIEVMIGKLSPYVVVGLIQTVVILVLARVLFSVPMAGGWDALALGVVLFILGSLSLGFLISTVARNQLQAVQMSFFYILPSILLSGFMFPFRGMPAWAQALGSVIPVTHFLRVVRGSLLKGLGLLDLWTSLAALAVFVVAIAAAPCRVTDEPSTEVAGARASVLWSSCTTATFLRVYGSQNALKALRCADSRANRYYAGAFSGTVSRYARKLICGGGHVFAASSLWGRET